MNTNITIDHDRHGSFGGGDGDGDGGGGIYGALVMQTTIQPTVQTTLQHYYRRPSEVPQYLWCIGDAADVSCLRWVF